MIFNINGKRILFIHIPKCGGSTIESQLNQLQGDNQISLDNGRPRIDLLWGQHEGIQLQHLTVSQALNKFQHYHQVNTGDFDFIFTVVRNPVDRLLSEANWQLTHVYFQYSFSWKHIIKQFNLNSPDKFCHYISQKDYIGKYKNDINIYSLGSLENLEERLHSITGKRIDFSKKVINKSNKFFTLANLTKRVKEEVIQCAQRDLRFFKKNKDKFPLIPSVFFEDIEKCIDK